MKTLRTCIGAAVRLDLDRPAGWKRPTSLEEVGQRLVVDDELVVEDDRDAVSLHADPGSVPLAGRPVGLHKRKFPG